MADTSLIFNIIARDKTGATFDKVKAGAAVAGAAIGAVLMSGVAAAIEKSNLDGKLSAQLGATPAQAEQIGKLSGAVYAQGFGEDMPAVSAAIKAAAQNGLVDMDNISSEAAKTTTANLLTVGDILEEDSERVSSAISQMLRTGLVDSAEEGMDLLVTATQKGVNKSNDLLDTVNEYGTQFRKLGLDGPTSLGLLSQAIQGGARDSDTAADAIKEFSIRAVDGSKASVKAFEDLGFSAKDMMDQFGKGGSSAAGAFDKTLEAIKNIKDPVKQSQVAVALFGTKAEDLGKALFNMDAGTAAKDMGNVAGATSKAADTAKSGAAGYGALGRQFQMALVDTLNLALPAVNAVFGFMQRNSSWVQPLAVGLGVLAVAFGIVVAVTWAWNAALALNPVTWIVLGIVALIAVIVLVATKTRFFQTIWGAVWGFMKTVGAWFAGPFANFFVSLWNKLVNGFNRVKTSIGNHINAVKSTLTAFKNHAVSIFNKVVDKGASIIAWFKNMPGKLRSALGSIFSPIWTGFKAAINRVISGWNNLSFTVGGGTFAGVSIPSTTIGTPPVPYLNTGAGMVRQEGLAYIHRGERITPSARVTPYRASSEGRGETVTLRTDGTKMAEAALEMVRKAVRAKGGDPVKVLRPKR